MDVNYVSRDTYGMYKDTQQGPGPALMGADTLLGNDVYNLDNEKLGTIKEFMIDMGTGRIVYAVLSYGGFLGIGDDYYPLPWPSLKYNVDLGGYQIMVTKDHLRTAPKYASSADWNWNDQQLARAVSAYYGVPMPS